MPRGGTKTKAKASTAIAKKEEAQEQLGVFPLIVGSFKGKLPGMDDYDPDKDRMMIGFQFGESMIPMWMPTGTRRDEITAYDFLTYPTDGLRKGHTFEPKGCAYSDLSSGVSTWINLPPVHIWGEGKWLADIIWEPLFDLDQLNNSWLKAKVEKAVEHWPAGDRMVPVDLYPFWVTTGEGTPGNNLYKVFELPEEVCKKTPPHHPSMWPEDLRKRTYGYQSSYTPTKPAAVATAPKTTTAPAMPAGTRYRCTDCGHWYTQQDLVGHKKVCVGNEMWDGEPADWAVMCHNECGCRTLDEACKPKAGFPRPKAEPKEPVISHGEESEGKEATVTAIST